jgi:hypothetical protein
LIADPRRCFGAIQDNFCEVNSRKVDERSTKKEKESGVQVSDTHEEADDDYLCGVKVREPIVKVG